MRRNLTQFLLSLLALCAIAYSSTLDNEAVVKMVKAGLAPDVIVTMVQTQPGNYKLDTDDVIALKTSGVPDQVIAAMVAKGTVPAAALASAGSAATAAPGAQPKAESAVTREVGVYYSKDGLWKDLLPEVVNWKSGGVMKSIATAGVVKGDVNGNIHGPSSRTKLAPPVEVLIYAPEGVAITEYQLIKLHQNKNNREFRTVTGGVFHVSGGATRDLLPFEGKKMASRTFSISLTNLKPGEYGILPPGLTTSSSASAQLGKMYTFSIIE